MSPEELRHDEIDRAARSAAFIVVQTTQVASAQIAAAAEQAARLLAEATRIDLQYIKGDLEEIKLRLDSKFVSIEAFDPVRKLVYGLVGLVLTAVIGTLLTLVLR